MTRRKRVTVCKHWDETPCAIAMRELMELTNGPMNMSRALGIPYRTVTNWQRRGQVSRDGALRIAATGFFSEAGWTKEKIRPDLMPWEWDK